MPSETQGLGRLGWSLASVTDWPLLACFAHSLASSLLSVFSATWTWVHATFCPLPSTSHLRRDPVASTSPMCVTLRFPTRMSLLRCHCSCFDLLCGFA